MKLYVQNYMYIKIQQIHIQYMTCIPYASLMPFLQTGLCVGVLFVCFCGWVFSVLIDAELMLFLSTATVVAVQCWLLTQLKSFYALFHFFH